MATNSLYNEVVNVTYEYLGPAANRFVIRQIRSHLGKDPEQLQRKDLRQLIDWIRLAMRFISNDTRAINQYMANLESLARATAPRAREAHGKGS